MPATALKMKDFPQMARLRIALSELESSDADLFRASLARLVNRLTQHWEWADLAHADLVIVDMDSLFGHMAWLKAHGAGKHVITFARSGTVHGSDLVLGKPLNDDAFAAVLEQAAISIDKAGAEVYEDESAQEQSVTRAASPAFDAQTMQLEAVETTVVPARTEPAHVMQLDAAGDMHPAAEPAVAAMPEPEPELELEPDPVNVADALVRRAPTSAMRVGDLMIDPERDVYYADATLKSLKNSLEREPSALQSVDANALATARAGKPQPLARLRWFAGLVATPGELGWGLRDDEKYKLSRWPQTEREFPRHFRIATAMMKEAATPTDLAAAANVPVAEVNDYINASRAAGWLEIQRDEPAPLVEEASQRKGLGRFRKPFGRA